MKNMALLRLLFNLWLHVTYTEVLKKCKNAKQLNIYFNLSPKLLKFFFYFFFFCLNSIHPGDKERERQVADTVDQIQSN